MKTDPPAMNRRRTLKLLGAGITGAGLAGCAGGGGDATPTPRVERETVVRERTVVQERTPDPADLTQIHTIEPEGSTDIPTYLYGISEEVWANRGIDLDFEVAAFGKFIRQISADLSQIGGISLPPIVQLANEGEDVAFVGIAQNAFQNHMLARSDDDSIQGPTDLEGKVLGLPGENSTTTHAQRAMILDEHGFDIVNDTAETRFAGPPVLWNLLLDGEIDACSQFLGFVISGLASGDAKTVFNPTDYWVERTGIAPAVAAYAARREWIEENPEVCLQFLLGWEEANDLLRDNAEEAIQNYGRLAGLTTDAEAELVREWIQDEKLTGPRFTQEVVDTHYDLLTLMMEGAGAFETLPEKDSLFVSWDELNDLAEDA